MRFSFLANGLNAVTFELHSSCFSLSCFHLRMVNGAVRTDVLN